MSLTPYIAKAETLIEALPYIQSFRGATVCCLVVFGIASATPTARSETFQFDAAHAASLTVGTSNVVSEWRARNGSAVLAPVQGASNGWCHAVARALPANKRSVDLGAEGVASPFHAAGATGTVAYAFAVVRCEAPADFSTLLDAPCSARFQPVAWPDEPWVLSTSQLTNAAAYAVNGAATNVFAGTSGLQLVEVFWNAPVAMGGLYVGGAAASPAWNRTWDGELAELVFLAATPTAPERDALWSYAALKWGVPVAAAGSDVAETLRSLGVSPGSLYASIVLVR
jgi:hypothetical protein